VGGRADELTSWKRRVLPPQGDVVVGDDIKQYTRVRGSGLDYLREQLVLPGGSAGAGDYWAGVAAHLLIIGPWARIGHNEGVAKRRKSVAES